MTVRMVWGNLRFLVSSLTTETGILMLNMAKEHRKKKTAQFIRDSMLMENAMVKVKLSTLKEEKVVSMRATG